MDGDIWVESKENAGSTFHFTARFGKNISAKQDEKEPVAVLKQNNLKGMKVLSVDDHETYQELVKEFLSSEGIAVELAYNGQEALDLMAKKEFDAVLLDCQMPVLDGYEMTKQLRANEQFKNIPIIAVTANAMKGDKENIIASGMNDYLAKPVDFSLLLSTLSKWLS